MTAGYAEYRDAVAVSLEFGEGVEADGHGGRIARLPVADEVSTRQAKMSELPSFIAEDVQDTPHGRVFATRVDKERPNDFGDLVGSEVLISWQGETAVYRVKGLERFMHAGRRMPGEAVGLLAEPVDQAQRIAYLEALIGKYANHVAVCEGVDFLSDLHERRKSESQISDEEWQELNRLADQFGSR